jgi:N-acyl-D-amino-acid deacylase
VLDLKIEGATVVDGTGAAGGRADVGVRDEAIVAIGDLSREHAGRSLNASGKVLAPGFIDMHSHSDWRLWENRRAESKIRQGVTTEVVGNCGFSPAPVHVLVNGSFVIRDGEHTGSLPGRVLRRP